MESWVQSWRPRTNEFCDFSSPCHEKVRPGHTKCCTCHTKSSSQNRRSHAPKCHLSQEISALTSEQLWRTCLLHCACHARCIFPGPLQMSHACHRFGKCSKTLTFCSFLARCMRCRIPGTCHAKLHLNLQKWSGHVVLLTFWLGYVLRATTACTFSTSQLPKVLRSRCVLYILTSKCASRHNGVHFFDMSTSKSGPTLWLGNVLRATTACTFSTFQLPKVVQERCVLCILTSNCASRHNGVQFFISHLPSGLRTRRFSEPTFRPSEATNHWKNTVFRDFPTFSRTWIFFLLRLSLFWSSFFFSALRWLFPSLLFICPYCRKFDF